MITIAGKGAIGKSCLQGAKRCSWRAIAAYPVGEETSNTYILWLFISWDSWTLDSWSLYQLMMPKGNSAFKEPKDAVDDPLQHTQWINKHQLHMFLDSLPFGIVEHLFHDHNSGQRCHREILSSRSQKMQSTSHCSIPGGWRNIKYLYHMTIYLLG